MAMGQKETPPLTNEVFGVPGIFDPNKPEVQGEEKLEYLELQQLAAYFFVDFFLATCERVAEDLR